MGFVLVKKITQLAVLIVSMLPIAVYAVPSITSTSGTVSHGRALTVSGSGFGTKAIVAPQQWDPVDGMYTGLSNGSTVPVGNGYPWASCIINECPKYKTVNPRGKFTAKYSNNASSNTAAAPGDGKATVGGKNYANGNHLYVTWWAWIALNGTIDNSQNKFTRFTTTGNWPEDVFQWTPGIQQMYSPTAGYRAVTYGNFSPPRNQWVRMEAIIDNTASPHKPRVNTLINGASVYNRAPGDENTTSGGAIAGSLNNLNGIYALGFDADNSGNAGFDFGEIYVDNTLARVEICNAATKSGSSHCEIQIPQTQWIDNQLQFKVNQGSFADNSTAYLFVIDANGNASSGKQITFVSGTTPPPAAPTGVKGVITPVK